MTNQEFSYFCKYAQDQNLASTLALKYNKAVQNIQRRYGIAPRTRISNTGINNMPINTSGSTYNRYLKSITTQESGGKYNAYNKSSGAMGLYQFMPKTLRGLGYKGSFQNFLNNPKLQTQYMHKFTQQNAKSLGFDLKTMNMQQAGYLAAAHYGGVGGAKKIMQGNRRYGTTNFHGKTPYGYMNDVLKRMYVKR